MRLNLHILFKILFVLLFLELWACKEPIARKPKQQGTTNFYKELVAENKKLINRERHLIKQFLQLDTLHNYTMSPSGFWYIYIKKNEEETLKPITGNVLTLEYNITDLKGNIIYEKQRKTYNVDKQDFIPALEDGIKLMKRGETLTFVIPSYRGFGIAGDGNKIGINQTIKSTVTLIDIK